MLAGAGGAVGQHAASASGCVMGGQVGSAGHLHDRRRRAGRGAERAHQLGRRPASTVGGTPAIEIALWRRIVAALPRLPELLRRVRALEQHLADGASARRPTLISPTPSASVRATFPPGMLPCASRVHDIEETTKELVYDESTSELNPLLEHGPVHDYRIRRAGARPASLLPRRAGAVPRRARCAATVVGQCARCLE